MSELSMGKCGTCLNWKPPTKRNDFSSLPNDLLYGLCMKIEMSESGVEELENPPLAVTLDGSYYKADLFTRAEFGCVLHETTEATR